jgi:arginase
MIRDIDLIGVPCALGAPDVGTAGGPKALRQAGLLAALHRGGHGAEWTRELISPAGTDRWSSLAVLCDRLAGVVGATRRAGHMPFVVGGDHTIAAGTWRGIADTAAGPFGLLWLDAHLDAHTVDDSPSGNPHGMPLALLLGEGEPRMARPCLSPQHVCVVGARSWEPEEAARFRRLGVRVFDATEIARRGLTAVMADALALVRSGTTGFGISIDLDVFDPFEAPGVNSPAPGGHPAAAWLAALRGLATLADCLAVEVVECDSERDVDGVTARLAVDVAGAMFAPVATELATFEDKHRASDYTPSAAP